MTMDDMGYRIDLVPSDAELIDPDGPYYEYVRLYAQDDSKYSADFALAFFKLMHIGTVNLTSDVKWWKPKSVEATEEKDGEASDEAPESSLTPAAEITPAPPPSKSSKKKKNKKKKKKSNQT